MAGYGKSQLRLLTLRTIFVRYRQVFFRCSDLSLIGNPVQVRDGPAAVTGDEGCMNVTVCSAQMGRRNW